MKKLPYGQCNFSEIVERGYAYVDKTRFIELLENENNTYQIFLRPRRFGKSLFLSVLENYYDITRKDKFESLFGDLYIGKHPTPDQGRYAVMSFDFSRLDLENREVFRASFLNEIERGVERFLKRYSGIFSAAAGGVMYVSEPAPGISALLSACDAAESADIPVYVIIDEYDNFATSLITMEDTYKKEVMSDGIVRTFYKALKSATRTSVRRMFITGVSPMILNDLTSGFNMATNLSLLPMYNTMFGFTSDEVEWLMDETGINKKLINVDLEYYYNGYRFDNDSEEKVYNSQMILFLFDQIKQLGKQPAQIVDPNLMTSYEQLQRLAATEGNREKLLRIVKEGGTSGEIYRSFSIGELNDEEHFVSFLFYMGMLTCSGIYKEGIYLKIPNYSIQTLYWEYLMEYISKALGEESIDISELSSVINTMAYNGDAVPYIGFFTENFFKRLSNRDLRDFDEKYIKVMMLSSLCLSKLYSPLSEQENINGYSDIYLEKRKTSPDVKYEYIFEIKYIKKSEASAEEIEKEFSKAINQIGKYKKDNRFAGRDDIKFIALVFIGKDRYEMKIV